MPNVPRDAVWSQAATKVIGNLSNPDGLAIDPESNTIFVADNNAHNVIAWTATDNSTRIVAGNSTMGNALNQLNEPTDIVYDKLTNSILVYDSGNDRIVRWSLNQNTTHGEEILTDIQGSRIGIDCNGAIYVSDRHKHEVRRYIHGRPAPIRVAGNGKRGSTLQQLDEPGFIVIDNEGTIYVSDSGNRRIVKWTFGATEGQLVCGLEEQDVRGSPRSYPNGLIIDTNHTVYVIDTGKYCIKRSQNGQNTARTIIAPRSEMIRDQEFFLIDLVFDRQYNLYAVDQKQKCVFLFKYMTSN